MFNTTKHTTIVIGNYKTHNVCGGMNNKDNKWNHTSHPTEFLPR